MSAPPLSRDMVLMRTFEGTLHLSSRDPTLGSKLRGALYLVTGRQTVGEMLNLAGGLAYVLEEELRTLLEMDLVTVVPVAAPRVPARA